jgi:hypothetical protein
MQEVRGTVKRMEVVQEAGDLLFVPSGKYSSSSNHLPIITFFEFVAKGGWEAWEDPSVLQKDVAYLG